VVGGEVAEDLFNRGLCPPGSPFLKLYAISWQRLKVLVKCNMDFVAPRRTGLPSGTAMTKEDLDRIIRVIKKTGKRN
jgi:hypothetical protein